MCAVAHILPADTPSAVIPVVTHCPGFPHPGLAGYIKKPRCIVGGNHDAMERLFSDGLILTQLEYEPIHPVFKQIWMPGLCQGDFLVRLCGDMLVLYRPPGRRPLETVTPDRLAMLCSHSDRWQCHPTWVRLKSLCVQ